MPDAAVDDRDAGSVSVVGARAGAGPGVLLEVLDALREVGEEPRALLATSLRVTAFCSAARAPEAVRVLHRRLVERRRSGRAACGSGPACIPPSRTSSVPVT